jgi:hypothetical protein
MITFTKLKNGDWGLRGETAELHQLEIVEVYSVARKAKVKVKVGRELFRNCGQSVHLIAEFIKEGE